jgi:hypothetical protein
MASRQLHRYHLGVNSDSSPTNQPIEMPAAGARVLGVGLDSAIGDAAQNTLRQAGLRATIITVTDDKPGDDRLIDALRADTYDAVNFGAGLSGQAPPQFGATEHSTVWVNRLLNIVHAQAPTAKIVLARGPGDVLPAIERELGK